MNSTLFAGLLAGIASAILLAAGAQGGAFALVPALSAPLPIIIVSIGWSAASGGLAALIAAVTFGFYFSDLGSFLPLFLSALILYFGPAAWFGYQILLAREDDEGNIEWYPIGRLLFWMSLLAAVAGLAPLVPYGLNYEAFQTDFSSQLEEAFSTDFPELAPSPEEATATAGFVARMAPAFLSIYWMIIMLVNLYLAGFVVRVSGRLKRPWPDFSEIRMPVWSAYAFAAGLIASFFSGLPGLVGLVLTVAISVALTLQGLILFHIITRGNPMRIPLLIMVYLSLFMFSFFHVIAGLFDVCTNIRERLGRRPPPRSPFQ